MDPLSRWKKKCLLLGVTHLNHLHFLKCLQAFYRRRGCRPTTEDSAPCEACLRLNAETAECPEIRFNPVKLSSIQISKARQQAVYDTKHRNVACEKCARWPSYRRCRGGLNLITASNIHLANKSRLETRAQEGKARLADAHNGGW